MDIVTSLVRRETEERWVEGVFSSGAKIEVLLWRREEEEDKNWFPHLSKTPQTFDIVLARAQKLFIIRI